MSDHDPMPDPIDKAYVRAEALLSDEAARAARRARVLAAVAQDATPAVAPAPAARRPAWRRGGWLAAASVAGLGVLIATHIYTPPRRQAQNPTAASSAAPMPAPAGDSAASVQPAPLQSATPAARGAAEAPRAEPPAPNDELVPAQPPPPPPPPSAIAPEAQAFPSPPPAPSAADVTAERRGNADAAESQSVTRGAEKATPGPGFAGAPAALASPESPAGPSADPAARLRAAASAGRTAAVDGLLAQGVAVDAADAAGNTALMDAIQADHPAVAASLRRHGASLDRRNRAGESARDMATTKGDAALDEALGLAP